MTQAVTHPENASAGIVQNGEKWLFLLACLLCGLPVWLPQVPPMVDLPQHAAQISMFLNLGKPDFPFSNEFELHWFTPYLLGYSLIALFTPLLGIVAACKLIVWLALATFALATRYLLRRAGADPYWAWLTFPVLYGFTYQWGLLNFMMAAPLGIFFLGYIWKQSIEPDWRVSLLIAAMLYLLFFAHALILGLFWLIAAAYWASIANGMRDFFRRAWPLLALSPAVLGWFYMALKHPVVNTPIEWDLSWFNTIDGYYDLLAAWNDQGETGFGRVNGFLPRLLGLRPDWMVTVFGLLLFALPLLAGARIARLLTRMVPLLCLVPVLMLLPSYLFGNVYTSQRFTLLAMPLFLLLLNPGVQSGGARLYLRLLAPVVAFGWIAFMTNNALKFDRDAAGFNDILADMAPGKRALSMVFEREDSHSIAPTFLHYGAWYAARKSGVTDPSFAGNYAQPIAYKPEYAPKATFQAFAWNARYFNWNAHQGYKYDYFIVRAPVDGGGYLFRTANCQVPLIAHSGMWWLYQPDVACRR